jgi:hypothetical protein
MSANQVGDRMQHKVFGEGTIKAITGDQARVTFDIDAGGGPDTRGVDLAVELERAPLAAPTTSQLVAARMVDGDVFILDAPDHVPAVWGRGDQVLWSEGESLVIAGMPGVGKTTLAAQIVRARICDENEVLGLPVSASSSRVLYLAMDRPQQIARALRRTIGHLPRELLAERLRFWKGPPFADIAKHPETLAVYASAVGADTIVVDSLKDAAVGLVDDEVGSGYNRARQLAIAEGIEVLELHHTVKRGANGGKPTTLADLYGSVWLSSGAGSVVLLAGDAGDPIVELLHLKTPAAEVGPMRVIHDHDAGTSAVWHSTDLMMMARVKGADGLTAKDAARALFSVETPKHAQVEKARRKLQSLAKSGQLDYVAGDEATSTPAVWTLTNTLTARLVDETPHADSEPSRREHNNHPHDTLTTLTPPYPHDRPPSYKEGARGVTHCDVCGEVLHYRLVDIGETRHPNCAGGNTDGP